MQPNGYRFITGGADSFVRVWNLLPVISSKYEDAGESDSESDEEINQNRVSAENGGKDPSVGSKVPSKKSASVGGLEDSKMNDAEGSDSDEGLTPEEKLKKEGKTCLEALHEEFGGEETHGQFWEVNKKRRTPKEEKEKTTSKGVSEELCNKILERWRRKRKAAQKDDTGEREVETALLSVEPSSSGVLYS